MENKTSKYFKYAIGEIVLVVIGILIALSINNWNENRKNTVKETQLLISFKKDLEKNIIELERVIKKSKNTSRKADSVLMLQKKEIEDVTLPKLLDFIIYATGFTVYSTHEGTVQDILGSGNLDIIKNDSIRLAIGSWEANIKTIKEFEKMEKKSVDDYDDYLQLHLDLYKDDSLTILTAKSKEMLLKDRVFLNHLSNRKYLPKSLNELYKYELPRLQHLIKLIDKEQ
ncbi:MAG: hypothetical protein IMY67_01390 [Bacteroidetes bacterium]|nr:hypothetical protein [Bacteroidota bacterium]